MTSSDGVAATRDVRADHNDSVLIRERLHSMAVDASSTKAAFLYGRLHAHEEARGRRWQQHFEATWKAAKRKSVRRWLR